MWDKLRDHSKCKRKTAKGNVFLTEKEARHAASVIQTGATRFINAFQCTVCNHWHIGSGAYKPEYQDVPVEFKLKHHPPVKISTSLGDVLREHLH